MTQLNLDMSLEKLGESYDASKISDLADAFVKESHERLAQYEYPFETVRDIACDTFMAVFITSDPIQNSSSQALACSIRTLFDAMHETVHSRVKQRVNRLVDHLPKQVAKNPHPLHSIRFVGHLRRRKRCAAESNGLPPPELRKRNAEQLVDFSIFFDAKPSDPSAEARLRVEMADEIEEAFLRPDVRQILVDMLRRGASERWEFVDALIQAGMSRSAAYNAVKTLFDRMARANL